MEEIQKRILIASGIVEIRKNNIPIKVLINYINSTTQILRKNNYNVERINEDDVIKLFRMYPVFGTCVDDNIIIDNIEKSCEKINKHILININDNLKQLLRMKVKYNIPIVFNESVVVYSAFSNDSIQDKLKSLLYYDKLNDAFLISFNDVSYNDILEYIIENSSKIKKSTLQIDELLEFKSKIDSLLDPKYYSIKQAFKLDIDKDGLTSYSECINNYYNISKENTTYLEENNKIKSLLGIFKRKIK